MDTLTIEGDTYFSSKHAAKVTGYAKDYVGQLCREGRVEARLVGRNWYVHEQSIREHRFGSGDKNKSSSANDNVIKDTQEHISSSIENTPVRYTIEKTTLLPRASARVDSHSTVVREEKKKPSHLEAMQQAWQEWFVKLQNNTVRTMSYEDEEQAPTKSSVVQEDTAADGTEMFVENIVKPTIDHEVFVKRIRQTESNQTKSVDMRASSTKRYQVHDDSPKIASSYTSYKPRKIVELDQPRGSSTSLQERFAHILNIALMLVALVAVIIVTMNFVYKAGGNLFGTVTGTTVYTVK